MPRLLLQMAVVGGLLVAVWLLSGVLLLLFLAILLACSLRGAASWLARHTGLPTGAMVALVAIVVLLLGVGAAVWIVPRVMAEGSDVVARVSQEWDVLRSYLGTLPVAASATQDLSLGSLTGHLAGPLQMVLGSTLDIVAGAVVVAVTALYLAMAPDLYIRGVLHLFPHRRRARLREVMEQTGHTLRLWFLGQLVDMLVVGVLAGAGLLIVGVPTPYALGVLSGLLTFVPYFGAVIAGIPAVLVALTVSTPTALYALGVYTLCHCVEGYIVAPLVQRHLVELPPAVTVMSMTVASTLFGVLGLCLGTPLAAAGLVMVQMMYVEDALGDHSVSGHGHEHHGTGHPAK